MYYNMYSGDPATQCPCLLVITFLHTPQILSRHSVTVYRKYYTLHTVGLIEYTTDIKR